MADDEPTITLEVHKIERADMIAGDEQQRTTNSAPASP
ncbi:MAG: hypothetical protein ACI9KE_002415 [Polyangiales bacterium]|jgi:hypothetical protein